MPLLTMLSSSGLKRKSSGGSISPEHPNRVKRESREVSANHFYRFSEQVMGNGDDVAPTPIGMKNVQHLPNAGPKQLGKGTLFQKTSARNHERFGIDPSISNTSGEYGDNSWNRF